MRLRTFRLLRVLAGLLLGLLVCPAIAAAQQTTGTAPAEKSYVLAYVLIGFVVVLGMMIVCRPGGRADKPKMVEQQLKHRIERMQGGGH